MLIFSLPLPSGAKFQLCAVIGCSFLALRHHKALIISFALPSGAHVKPCAYHCLRRRALSIPSFAPAGAQHLIIHANGRVSSFAPTSAQISLSRQQALVRILFVLMGAYHCPDSAFSPFPSIAPAIGCKIEASRHQPLGANLKHHATIQRSNSASHHHWALIITIAPPLDASFKHWAAVWRQFSALRRHWALLSSIIVPSCASSSLLPADAVMHHCAFVVCCLKFQGI